MYLFDFDELNFDEWLYRVGRGRELYDYEYVLYLVGVKNLFYNVILEVLKELN